MTILFQLNAMPIGQQLQLEEDLLRNGTRDFCLINTGAHPAIVMGISNEAEKCIDLNKLPSSIHLIRRFSGGGTVMIDENTVFVTFIFNKDNHSFLPYPEPILRWAQTVFASSIPELKLYENDFVIGEKKCGGNALYIKKNRWLIHTSFLWDYDPAKMELLKYPPKTPAYRQGRSHTDFLYSLSSIFPQKNLWIEDFKKNLCENYSFEEKDYNLFYQTMTE